MIIPDSYMYLTDFFKGFIFIYECFASMHACEPCACQESIEHHRTGVTGGYESTCGFTELNLDALYKMQVILTAEPTP